MVKFCEKLSKLTNKTYRLPSEAEWEYACRAGTTSKYYFGDTISKELANYSGNIGETTDVGSYPANSFGLYDMHGNVWEWCADYYQDNYNNAPTDSSSWEKDSKYRVLRDGSWIDLSNHFRSASRGRNVPSFRNKLIGFRVVRML
ncbi:formylglycine-generating enzyme family protein [Thiotrichales bacterium HSG1]|nr:formylglycine-generating enzyme family protein [Thiotrichales bacterium HSG1]